MQSYLLMTNEPDSPLLLEHIESLFNAYLQLIRQEEVVFSDNFTSLSKAMRDKLIGEFTAMLKGNDLIGKLHTPAIACGRVIPNSDKRVVMFYIEYK